MSQEHQHPSDKPPADVVQPTAKEAFFFLTILSNMKNKPDVDWEVVAHKAGFSNAKTATTRYSQIKKKLGWNEYSTLPAGALTDRTPGKKRASKTNGSGTNISPTKVRKPRGPRTPKTPKSSVKKEEAVEPEPVPEEHYESPDDEEHDEEMSGVKQEMHALYVEDHEEEVTYYDTPDA